jgi:hypothetical protein
MSYNPNLLCLDCIDYLRWSVDDNGNRVCSVCGGKRIVLTKNFKRLAAVVRCRRVADRLSGKET